MNIIHKIPTLIAILLHSSMISMSQMVLAEFSAIEIMDRVDQRNTGASSKSTSTMVLIDKKGRERVRHLQSFSKSEINIERTMTYFLSPADVKGTGYLSFDYTVGEKDDESWLYLPALRKVNRIAAGDKSDSFIGSDFTYSDINGVNIHWYQYSLLSESELVDGFDTWKLESTPKPVFSDQVFSETGYEKSHLWIRKDNFVRVQAQIWVKKGKRVKYFSAKDLEKIDDIWTARTLQMVTVRNGKREHATVLEVNNIQYNIELDEALFSPNSLARSL